jgi:hypothetical protein
LANVGLHGGLAARTGAVGEPGQDYAQRIREVLVRLVILGRAALC